MMTQDRLQFVLLHYSADSKPGERAGFPLLVIFAPDALQIVIHPGWQQRVELEDREYLTLMMSDWRQMSADEWPRLMESLSEFSVGPLQTADTGEIQSKSLSDLIRKISSNDSPGS